jgi:hypothetical protein
VVHQAEAELGGGFALVGGLPVPEGGFGEVAALNGGPAVLERAGPRDPSADGQAARDDGGDDTVPRAQDFPPPTLGADERQFVAAASIKQYGVGSAQGCICISISACGYNFHPLCGFYPIYGLS